MKIKKRFTETENFFAGLSCGTFVSPEGWVGYFKPKENHLLHILYSYTQDVKMTSKYIIVTFRECDVKNKELAMFMCCSISTVIKYSEQLEKMRVIETRRTSYATIRKINYELLNNMQKKFINSAYIGRCLRDICGDKPITDITDGDIKEANRRAELIEKYGWKKAHKMFGNNIGNSDNG